MTSTAIAPGTASAASRPDDTSTGHTRIARVLLGPAGQPRWARPGALLLLAATAVLYLWNLTVSGWGNEYYAAAAQAGTQSWKALLFGSLDAGNAITVDKPPAAQWVLGLSGRLLGFSSWSVLLPQALMGVAAVGLLYATVRRLSGPGAGLLAGAILALTPVAVLIFRFDNPDALLVLLLVVAAYCTVRALESGGGRLFSASTGWLALAGVAVGFGFLTKMMQAFLILPGLGLAYLIAANPPLRRRIAQLLVALGAVVVSAGWYIALVELWPADSRPFIGGSADNSLWQLAVEYNGLGRIFGGDGNMSSSGGSGGFAGFSGSNGIARLFNSQMGGEISWLLPTALIGLAAGLWLTRRAPRTDRTRAAFVLWGGWLLITGLTFSYMSGTVHPYYTVALAPAIGALVALSVRELWRRATHPAARLTLAAMASVTGIWSFTLLARTPDWLPWLRWTVLTAALLVAAALLLGTRRARRYTLVLAAAGLLAGLGGTTAYALTTAGHAHSGGNPASGPTSLSTSLSTGGMPGGHMPGSVGSSAPNGPGATSATGTETTSGDAESNGDSSTEAGSDNPTVPGGEFGSDATTSDNAELTALLQTTGKRWTAATIGANSAATLALDSGQSVMAVGGFTGSDNSPTLEQFQAYVADGDIGYFVEGRTMGGSDNAGSRITAWVKANFTAVTVGGNTVYDLSAPLGS